MICALVRTAFAIPGWVATVVVDAREAHRASSAMFQALNGWDAQEKVPAGERVASGDTAPAGHTSSALSGSAVSAHPTPRGASNDPAGHLPPCPAGSPNLTELIVDVLTRYVTEFGSISTAFRVEDVAQGIAERVEKHSPAVDLTFDDLTLAAAVVANYAADVPRHNGGVRVTIPELNELARRLVAAAKVAPTP